MKVFADVSPLYWQANLPVIPVRGKRAFLGGWTQFCERMPTRAEQAEWLAEHPSMNLGLPLGPASGLFMIDIDTHDPGLQQAIEGCLPATPWRRVGSKGCALAFRYADHTENFKRVGPDGAMIVEGLGLGNQLVCPPSIHPDTGQAYIASSNLWEVLECIPELPIDFRERIEAHLPDGGAAGRSPSAQGYGIEEPRIAEGGRHNFLVAEAGRLRNFGLKGSALGGALHALNRDVCSPPADEDEVDAIVRAATEDWGGGDGLPYTDLGNARRLVASLGGAAQFVQEKKSWVLWDGIAWKSDTSAEIERAAKAVGDDLLNGARGSKIQRKAGLRAQSRGAIRAMIDLAQTEPGIPISALAFDLDRDVLNTPSGVVDLKTGNLRSGSPEEFHTKLTAVPYDAEAECPTFRRFLSEVFPDPELVSFMQRWAGYCLTGRTDEHKFVVASGAGRNGKSTFFNVLSKVLGDYAKNTPMSTFLQRQQGAASNDLAALNGARLVLANEGNKGQALDAAMVKGMTGGDQISARYLYQEFVTYTPMFKPVLISNHVPEMDASDPAIWARTLIVPFKESFLGREDTTLPDRLEQEMAGILRWAVEGAVSWYAEGLAPPLAVSAAVDAFHAEMDVIGAFIDDRCSLGQDCEVAASMLYREFESYCKEAGVGLMSSTMFGRELTRRGFAVRKTKGLRVRTGLSLRPFSGTY